jgi:hypothetical protein
MFTKTTEENIYQRFYSKVKVSETECWEWVGAHESHGYGTFYVGNKKKVLAYRWIFLRTVGTPPKNYVLDHLCKNKGCVNPNHLEPVTNKENGLRSDCPNIAVYKTGICKKGHLLEGENLRINKKGKRICVACTRANHREYYHRGLLRSLNSTSIQLS